MEYKRYKDLDKKVKGWAIKGFAMCLKVKDTDTLKDFYFDENGWPFTAEEVKNKSSVNGGQLKRVFIKEIKILLAGCEQGFKDENITTIGAIERTVDKLLAEVKKTKILK